MSVAGDPVILRVPPRHERGDAMKALRARVESGGALIATVASRRRTRVCARHGLGSA